MKHQVSKPNDTILPAKSFTAEQAHDYIVTWAQGKCCRADISELTMWNYQDKPFFSGSVWIWRYPGLRLFGDGYLVHVHDDGQVVVIGADRGALQNLVEKSGVEKAENR